jgi:hypothetical protein
MEAGQFILLFLAASRAILVPNHGAESPYAHMRHPTDSTAGDVVQVLVG